MNSAGTVLQRASGRVVAAAGLTVVVVLGAFAAAFFGVGRYLDDYCWSRAPQPVSASSGGRGPFWELPATIRCEWAGVSNVTVTDWLPLLWVGACVLAAVAMATTAWWRLVLNSRPDGKESV